MNKMTDPTPPFHAWSLAKGFLSTTMHGVRTNPVMWSAILLVAGSLSFYVKSAHIGTIFISAIGILWMWQDMLDDETRAAPEVAVTVAA